MTARTILIAHRTAAVRDRFSVALAEAHHTSVTADSAGRARGLAGSRETPVSLAIVDLALSDDPIAFVRELRGDRVLPVLVFSGSVASATQVPALAAMNVGYINEHAGTAQILPALAPHLFPDSFNRRVSSRVTIGVPVSYRSGETIAGALTLDVGRCGLAIRTLAPLPKGTTVQVKFRLPGTPADIGAVGRVAWSDRKVGMGVQFDTLSIGDQHVIDEFVERQAS